MIWTMWPLKICASCGHKRIRYCYDFKCIFSRELVVILKAGCDIVGINIVEPTETIKQVTALGRRF